MILIIMLAICFAVLILGILTERYAYNNGICKCCGKKLRHFDTDSQGGRGYTCDDMHTVVWVSYNCVDRYKQKARENKK